MLLTASGGIFHLMFNIISSASKPNKEWLRPPFNAEFNFRLETKTPNETFFLNQLVERTGNLYKIDLLINILTINFNYKIAFQIIIRK